MNNRPLERQSARKTMPGRGTITERPAEHTIICRSSDWLEKRCREEERPLNR